MKIFIAWWADSFDLVWLRFLGDCDRLLMIDEFSCEDLIARWADSRDPVWPTCFGDRDRLLLTDESSRKDLIARWADSFRLCVAKIFWRSWPTSLDWWILPWRFNCQMSRFFRLCVANIFLEIVTDLLQIANDFLWSLFLSGDKDSFWCFSTSCGLIIDLEWLLLNLFLAGDKDSFWCFFLHGVDLL